MYSLGYVLDPLPGHERFANRLAIPYLTPAGPVHIKFRCIEDHVCKDEGHAKYDCEPGYSGRMFGVLSLGGGDGVVGVCEGEFDAMVATTRAGIPSVAIPGANAWRPHYQFLFEAFADVIVLADGDEAGGRLAEKVASEVYNAKVVQLPKGEDVNSFVLKFGGAALRERCGMNSA